MVKHIELIMHRCHAHVLDSLIDFQEIINVPCTHIQLRKTSLYNLCPSPNSWQRVRTVKTVKLILPTENPFHQNIQKNLIDKNFSTKTFSFIHTIIVISYHLVENIIDQNYLPVSFWSTHLSYGHMAMLCGFSCQNTDTTQCTCWKPNMLHVWYPT